MCAACKIIINHLDTQAASTRVLLAELSRKIEAGEVSMSDNDDFVFDLIQQEVAAVRGTLDAVKGFARHHQASERIIKAFDKL